MLYLDKSNFIVPAANVNIRMFQWTDGLPEGITLTFK